MPGNIYVNQKDVEEKAGRIESAVCCLDYNILEQQDRRTTLPANPDGRAAYEREQSMMERLGEALEQEAENIRSLQVSFAEFDDMMGELARMK